MAKTVELTLATKARVQTDGTTNPLFLKHLAAEVKGVGPALEDIQVRWSSSSFTTNFQWRVEGEYSNDGENWVSMGATTLMGEDGTSGSVNGSAVTDRTKFGRDLRFTVVVSNVAGTAIDSGNLESVTVSLRLH